MLPFVAQIAREFSSGSASLLIEPLGRGLINDTYRITEGKTCWVLQRINRQVFPEPLAVMANFRKITDHALQVTRRDPESRWRLPEIIPAKAGSDVHQDERGEYWRAITYIDQAEGLSTIRSLEQAQQVGRALGWFHSLASDLSTEDFFDTLPGFHVTPSYLNAFDEFSARVTSAATAKVTEAMEFVTAGRSQAGVLEAARDKGRLCMRVIHGDPKLDNVLFDRQSGQAVSLVDLDTVKPGLIQYDLGDCFRSCCNLAGEESRNGEDAFDIDIFRAILSGYLQEAAHILSPDDRYFLYDAIWLLPFELGLRFLTDHLAGDVYFKVEQTGQNLDRALGQFRLVRSIEAQQSVIQRVILDLL